jgi:uncharacterized protein YigA (DUF484 family)
MRWSILSPTDQSVDSRLDGLETNLDIQGSSMKGLADRMGRMEDRVGKIEERANRNSDRVKGELQHNLDQDAALTTLLERVHELKTATDAQTAILTKLETGASKVLANPLVRSLLVMIGTALMTWLASHGGHLK